MPPNLKRQALEAEFQGIPALYFIYLKTHQGPEAIHLRSSSSYLDHLNSLHVAESSRPRHEIRQPYLDYLMFLYAAECFRPTHRIFQVGQLATRSELFELRHWVLDHDLSGAPLLVIESGAMALPTPALAVGVNGYFYLNLVAQSFPFDDFLLDVIRAICDPYVNVFGKRKRVFVERPFPATEERRFEFIGEFSVDIVPETKWLWRTLPLETKTSILAQYTEEKLTYPAAQFQFIGDRYWTGSLVRSYYDNGDFIPLVRLIPYRQEPCYFISMPLDACASHLETDWDPESLNATQNGGSDFDSECLNATRSGDSDSESSDVTHDSGSEAGSESSYATLASSPPPSPKPADD
ncbi:hypothetical protein B0H19DRAFT_474878 [Mycena capillaripes]|nr:hypothetical protein B0H19DRAFT_474878 [Mycena capillaripes]